MTRGSVPAKAVADASCDRARVSSSSRSARRHARRSWSGRHFCPHEPGEFAGDGGGHDGAAVFARREVTAPPTQPDLRSPGAKLGHRWEYVDELATEASGMEFGYVLARGPHRRPRRLARELSDATRNQALST